MSISNYLIEKFFQGDATDEEKQQVMEFFRNNPEKLAQYLTEDSWKDFAPDIRQGAPTDKIRGTIEARIGEMPTTVPVKKILYAWVAAASVIAATSLVFLLHQGGKNPAPAPQVASTIKKAPSLTNIKNPSSAAKVFFLPDSSKVELGSNSDITFDGSFTGRNRHILLNGQATFTVKKDHAEPFEVLSGDIATIVLGTVFSVNNKNSQYTTVRLYSGKVMVKKDGPGDKTFKDIYLTPGQQLTFDKKDFSVRIRNVSETIAKAGPASPVHEQQVFDFTEKPLAEIFSLLRKEYKVTIAYDTAALQNMSFTGRLDRNRESLESFLNTLCDLNELTLKKISDKSFSIQAK